MWSCLIIVLFGEIIFVSPQNFDDCRCVSFHLCRESEGTIITDGEGLIDERIGPLCPSCNCTGPNVCCSLTNKTLLAPKAFNRKPCGHRNPDGVGFKLGTEASDGLLGEFPWMIGIFENGTYRCGGSLIHPSVVLTAAHCVKLPNSIYTARAGEYDSGSTIEILKHQDLSVDSVKMHENFNPTNYHNDIALLFLKGSFKLAPHINVACLVPSNIVAANVRCYVTGWGKTQFGVNGKNLPILRKVDLPLVNSKMCQENLRETRLGPYFELDKSFVCAGGEKDKDACTGDGGGPLVCPIDGEEERYQQVGITAWGIGCNDENVPGVYTNVAFLRKWIDKQMTNKKLDVSEYQSI